MILEASGGDTCQIVMHLQMCGEKLIKSYLARHGAVPRTHRAVHNHFADLSNIVVGSPRLRSALMGREATRGQASKVLSSLNVTMRRVESLNPTVAGGDRPNCEYPWEDPPGVSHAPVRHRFGNAVGKAARARLYRALDRILSAEGA